MRVAITGAGGFIGGRLVRDLTADGHSVSEIPHKSPDFTAMDGADAIVHLAGEPLAQRWNSEIKKKIFASRVEGTRRLVDAIRTLVKPPSVLICASAVGIYGSRGDEILTEKSPLGDDFLASVCLEWETEADAAAVLGIRVVKLRSGMVLGREGGALAKMLPVFRLGLGGRLGSGRQWVSWIHIDDLIALIRYAISFPTVLGPVNAVATNPVTNAVFTADLGAALRRPAFLPAPELALRVVYGEMSQVLLSSQRAIPVAAEAAGFRFRYPQLPLALRALLG